MSSAGHADNSIGNYNNNRNLLKNNRTRYAKVKEAYIRNEALYSTFEYQKLSPEELHKLKKKIRVRIVFERQRRAVISVILALPILLGVLYLLVKFAQNWLFKVR